MVLANNDQMAKKLVNCTFVILNILYRLVGGQYLCGGGWGNVNKDKMSGKKVPL